MTSHADHLRSMANGPHPGLSYSAADALEYRVEHQHIRKGSWHPVTRWSPEWPFHEGYYKADDERVVCRRVSEPQEVTDE